MSSVTPPTSPRQPKRTMPASPARSGPGCRPGRARRRARRPPRRSPAPPPAWPLPWPGRPGRGGADRRRCAPRRGGAASPAGRPRAPGRRAPARRASARRGPAGSGTPATGASRTGRPRGSGTWRGGAAGRPCRPVYAPGLTRYVRQRAAGCSTLRGRPSFAMAMALLDGSAPWSLALAGSLPQLPIFVTSPSSSRSPPPPPR